MSSGYVSGSRDGTLLNLRVSPGARRSSIEGPYGEGALRVRVAAPPADGRANEELIRLLSGVLNVPGSDLTLVRGASGRDKTVLVRGVAPDEVREGLDRHPG